MSAFEPAHHIDQLIKAHVPAFMEAHFLVSSAARFVFMEHDNRVVGLPAAFLERQDGVNGMSAQSTISPPFPMLAGRYPGSSALFMTIFSFSMSSRKQPTWENS